MPLIVHENNELIIFCLRFTRYPVYYLRVLVWISCKTVRQRVFKIVDIACKSFVCVQKIMSCYKSVSITQTNTWITARLFLMYRSTASNGDNPSLTNPCRDRCFLFSKHSLLKDMDGHSWKSWNRLFCIVNMAAQRLIGRIEPSISMEFPQEYSRRINQANQWVVYLIR